MAGSLRARVIGMALAGARDALETIEARVAGQGTSDTGRERQRQRVLEVLERDRALSTVVMVPLVAATPVPAANAPNAVPPVPKNGQAVPGQEVPCEEPIRTRSMAKLLAAQGYPHRALAIYRYLLAVEGDDAALAAEITALQAHLGAHEALAGARALAD